MALVAAQCTQCGGKLFVDDTKDAVICQYCGMPFITEKAINNYITNNVHNVTNNVTKIIMGNEKDEGNDHFERGLTQLKLEDWAKAREEFEQATKLSPEVAKYHFYLFYAINKGMKSDCFYLDLSSQKVLKNFFKLATDEDKKQLGEEFGFDLSKDETITERDFYDKQGGDIVDDAFVDKGKTLFDKEKFDWFMSHTNLVSDEYKQRAIKALIRLVGRGAEFFEKYQTDDFALQKTLKRYFLAVWPFMTDEQKEDLLSLGMFVFNPMSKIDGKNVWCIVNERSLPQELLQEFAVDDDGIDEVAFIDDAFKNAKIQKCILTPNINGIYRIQTNDERYKILDKWHVLKKGVYRANFPLLEVMPGCKHPVFEDAADSSLKWPYGERAVILPGGFKCSAYNLAETVYALKRTVVYITGKAKIKENKFRMPAYILDGYLTYPKTDGIYNYDYNEIDKNVEWLIGYYPELSKIKKEKIKGRN